MEGAPDQGVAGARAVGDAYWLDLVVPLALDAGVVATSGAVGGNHVVESVSLAKSDVDGRTVPLQAEDLDAVRTRAEQDGDMLEQRLEDGAGLLSRPE